MASGAFENEGNGGVSHHYQQTEMVTDPAEVTDPREIRFRATLRCSTRGPVARAHATPARPSAGDEPPPAPCPGTAAPPACAVGFLSRPAAAPLPASKCPWGHYNASPWRAS